MSNLELPNKQPDRSRQGNSNRGDDINLDRTALGWLEIERLRSGEMVSFASLQSRDRFNLDGVLIDRIKECLRNLSAYGQEEISYTHHWPHRIGFDDCVERVGTDEITYAKLRPSGNWIPLVHNREAEPTSTLHLVLRKTGPEQYILLVGAMGRQTEFSPTDKRLSHDHESLRRSVQFWNEHALVARWMYQNHRIIIGSEQIECPWK